MNVSEQHPSRAGRRGRRTTRRIATATAIALVLGVTSGTGSRADEALDAVTLTYDCPLPGSSNGSTRVTARVRTDLPADASAGVPIDPGQVTVDTTAPFDDLAGLLPEGTTALASEAELAVQVRHNGETADATWSRLAAQSLVPGEGEDLRLTHLGQASTITVGSPGDVTLSAGELRLSISPVGEADKGVGEPVVLTCSPAEGQDGTLATVPVSGEDSSDTAGADTGAPSGREGRGGLSVAPEADETTPGAPETCPDVTIEGEPDPTYALPPLPGTELQDVTHGASRRVCTYAAGLAAVRKQNGSMIINDPSRRPTLMSMIVAKNSYTSKSTPGNGFYNRQDSIGQIDLPDAESTFLTFDFTPVTARVSFDTGPVTATTGTRGRSPNKEVWAAISFDQSLRLHDVSVNGTPLDVGPNCRSKAPFRVVLEGTFGPNGTQGTYTNVLLGGLLTSKNYPVDIPPFSGCGSQGEDLDALFTAAISGPGNLIAMNQATVCIPDFPAGRNGCPPAAAALPALTLPTL
ncbi:DUF6801 domain-containing protein [Streptomyces xanthii]|uniref:DUF6801 domain-containing protein n=1 Tax=Streptomyces xanthii TaxID=2768069 RepID=A0A7H1BCN5_9ACTN|nr:DUF6801 domain-containing protein [Streptomyces xanthii]QNS06490.1 hypothetical protein IAG42_24830 [Streptomyces xanthii]